MKRRIVAILILLLQVVPSLAVGMTCIGETKAIDTGISQLNDSNLTIGITRDTLNKQLHLKIMEQSVTKEKKVKEKVTKEKRFEEYNRYANCFVNIRKKPNKDSERITTVEPNTLVRVVGKKRKWSKVVVGDIHGYIKSEYLSKDEIPISKLNRWGIELTEDEIYTLALIVWKEAGNQSMTGKEAVVEVVFNRMISETFGGDLYSVLSRKGQFNTWKSRNNSNPTEEEYKAIHNVLQGRTYILDYDYVYFSTRKANGYDFIKIGNHWFGKGK